MKANANLLLAGAGLALAAPGQFSARGGSLVLKRTGNNLCDDCTYAGVAMPDKHTIQLPLENYFSEQCPPIYIGSPDAPTASSRVCLDFVDSTITFSFEPFPGFNYKSGAVSWKLKGNALDPGSWSPPPPTVSYSCGANPSGNGGLTCTVPFSDILNVSPTTSAKDLLAGMCPNGDSAGLILYLQFFGLVQSASDSSAPTVAYYQQPPCETRDSATGQCTARKPASEFPYIEVAYRCSTCNVAACPTTTTTTTTTSTTTSSTSTSSSTSTTSTTTSKSSTTTSTSTSKSSTTTSTSSTTTSKSSTTTTTKSSTPTPSPVRCDFGTAFGYVPGKSVTLDTQPGQGCNRWGWYATPTLAEMQSSSGFTGTLYVGAGNNDLSKATAVGTFVARADAAGRVTVRYLLSQGYALDEVHVDLHCLPIDKCAPGSYTFGAGPLSGGQATDYTTDTMPFPSCHGGSKAALIVHAAVDKLVAGGSSCS